MKMNRRHFITAAGGALALSAVPRNVLAFDTQGEGSMWILEPSEWVCGRPVKVVLEITAGPSGIPVGGGVYVGFHHAALWNTDYGFWSSFQTVNPNGNKYIGIIGDQADNFSTVWKGWAKNEEINRAPGGPPANDWTGSTPLIFHQCFQARVKDHPIPPGGRVLVTIGTDQFPAVPPIVADKDHELFLATDSTGKGVFYGVAAEQPKMDLVAAEPHHLIASAQMVQETGKPFELLIRAEDRYYNTAKSFNGTVTVRMEQGGVLARNVEVKNGLARVQVKVDRSGPQRLRLDGDGLDGRSEPIMVFEEAPACRIYYGDMHGHTRISDGCGADADEYYCFGRDEANLDVCALTDHWHYDWPQMQHAARQYYQPGRFVTFLGEEAGTNLDHINLYFADCNAPHTDRYHIKQQDCHNTAHNHYMANGCQVIGGPHHFAFDRGEKEYPWIGWDSAYERFAEIVSNHGTSEFDGNPNPLHTTDVNKTMQAGLAMGRRFGVIGSSDTHVSKPGRSNWMGYRGGLAAFLAPELTREAIWDAWWNYRVYAAEFDRIYMDFSVNGNGMGSEVSASDGKAELSVSVVGADDGITVELLKNNQVLKTEKAADGIVNFKITDFVASGEHWYYVRATQANGQRAWSTAVWVV